MKKNILIFGGIVGLVLLLAGAMYVGGRLLSGQGLPGLSSNGPNMFVGNGGNGGQEVRINADDILPAKELPQTSAVARGLFDHRQDNSIFVGTGQVMVTVEQDPSGKVETSAEHDGPVVEVVVTAQTVVYQDVTMQQYNGAPPQGQQIQQVIEPGNLDGLGESSMITVWGRKTGERIIAEVLVYSPPAFIK
jgi:hypothetical protein